MCQTDSTPSRSRYQFRLRTLFVATTAFALFYWTVSVSGTFGIVVVWLVCLLIGPVVGIARGIRLSPDERFIGATRGGIVGGVIGFLTAALLLSPFLVTTIAASMGSELLLGLMIGTFLAAGFGGMTGLAIGIALDLSVRRQDPPLSADGRNAKAEFKGTSERELFLDSK